MDEQYADPATHKGTKRCTCPAATCLTGVLVPVGVHRAFRERYYGHVADAIRRDDNAIGPVPPIHASKLFPGSPDLVKFNFLEAIVSLVAEFGLQIYRVGYYHTTEVRQVFGGTNAITGLCFSSLLLLLKEQLASCEIWPVMETDRSDEQDRLFAGHIQQMDYFGSLIGAANLTVDNANLGEMHHSTKKSIYGTVTDCISYLLDARFLLATGIPLTPFKSHLAEIASRLGPSVVFDEVIRMHYGPLPPDYHREGGPLRYMVPITPS